MKKWMLLIFITIILINLNNVKLYATEIPLVLDTEYIYFDLYYGDVSVSSNSYSGYVLENGVATQKTGTVDRKIYIYQSNGDNTIWENGLPKYERVASADSSKGSTWGEYITNNSNLSNVINNWSTQASKVNRKATTYKILINGSGNYDVTIDNIWSSYHKYNTSKTDGGLTFYPNTSVASSATITLKGDNRFGNIFYATQSYNNHKMTFKAIDNATVTVADFTSNGNCNHYNSAIGGSDSAGGNTVGIVFESGIVYAGTTYADNCTAIGAGGNAKGVVTVNGGTITAVCSSTGVAIGGGIGFSSVGGDANVTINGGDVYAYNFGYNGIPAAAIGGGSSSASDGNASTTITINGGTVYAESVAGTAIGGGSSKTKNGGSATINIGGTAVVTARSVSGSYNGATLNAGAAIGGGTGGSNSGVNGGNATVNISGNAKLYTGSIGGGKTNNQTGRIGNATIKITGTPTILGQFIMAAGSENPCSFNMSGGVIDNSTKTDSFQFIEENGGALHVENGEAVMNGGEITGCTNAINGGAICVSGGNFIMNGGKIYNNVADNGGAVYVSAGDFSITGGSILNNNATNGGAAYVTGGSFSMSGGTIEQCNAVENGGAICVLGGDFTITDGAIGRISEDIKFGCRATRGGAVYISDGTYTMNGGVVEGNTATNSGGGIQISDGNVYITGGKISSNVARGESSDAGYGGGIFVDGGEVISITGGEISSNVAARNGGGIEVKTNKEVTVDVYSGKFIKNVADECGGAIGIECDSGTINIGKEACDGLSTSSHIHPELSENLSGVQGGGFYMTGANAMLNIYCGFVDNNIVVDIENNIDQSSGTVNLYDGVLIGNANEGIIIVGGTFVDKRTEGEEIYKIMYYSNFEGSTVHTEAYINKGSLITMPGNIYGVEGYEVIGWVKDKNNTTMVDYEIGQVVEVSEDLTLYAMWVPITDNEPKFMIIIPTEISFNSRTNTLVFDMETTLSLFPRDKILKIRLKEEDFKLKLEKSDAIIDTVDYKLMKNGNEIESGGVVSEFYSDSMLITYNKKEHLEIYIVSTPRYSEIYEDMLTFEVAIEDD